MLPVGETQTIRRNNEEAFLATVEKITIASTQKLADYTAQELRELVREGWESGSGSGNSMKNLKAEPHRRFEASLSRDGCRSMINGRVKAVQPSGGMKE